ncbi:mitochondrial import receptor subunit TOM40-1-like protein [Tanacetum coccineum]|uniref:Mitochondrial import receptor subunit TOM40-1-like protein n=1 Tax=Tanacetum coccineum TaxID=301880 RepID=A0ABQ5DGH7_9ASTR
MVALSYVQKVSEKVSLATDLTYNYMSRDATASFGYDYMLCQCRLKRKIDSNGCTSALLEERLNMGLNFILSAENKMILEVYALRFLNILNATLHLVDILDSTEKGPQSDSESSETSANESFSNRRK